MIRRKMTGSDGLPGQSARPDLPTAVEQYHLSTGESLLEASRSRVLVLVFLRHFGCTFTRQILRELEQIKTTADARGAQLVLVHMLRGGEENRYLPTHGDIPRIADPHCDLYRAFGLGKGSLLELFGPRVWILAMLSIFKGCGVGYLAGDGRQMPGAFVFHNGAITACQRARSASDLPDLPALFDSPNSAKSA